MKRSQGSGGARAVPVAWAGWCVLFLVTAAIILHDSSRSVLAVYRFGALRWISGETLYEFTGVGGFTYLPQAAILYVPFALAPPLAGEVFWRLVSIGVFAAGLRGFARLAGERSGKDHFPLMTLLTIPMVWDCARNGQATLIMTGFMLLAVVGLARTRWWWSALWLALAVAVKPLAIVLMLLIAAVERPMTVRATIAMAAVVLFPFLTQRPAFVVHQYSAFLQNTALSAHVGMVAHGWTTPFTALRVAGVDAPERIQTMIRVAGAIATLALCWLGRRRHSLAFSAIYLYSFAALYLILFSPRTENNTYAMLGPVLAVFFAEAVTEKRTGEKIMLGGIVAVLIGSRQLEHLLTPHAADSWLGPLMAVGVAVYLVVRLLGQERERQGAAAVRS